jgi:hypothetical protein
VVPLQIRNRLVVDVDTFLTILYVMVDDFCQSRPQKEQHPGPDASLSPSEVITLAIFARWARFTSERDFYRYASARLIGAFPSLPDRSQFNRLVRHSLGLIEEIALHLAEMMETHTDAHTKLSTAGRCPFRDAKRRGEGWLAGRADIGWSNSLGWYEGFSLLTATDPTGVLTGFGFCGASVADQQVAESFFAVRHRPNPRLSVGSAFSGAYVAYSRALRAKITIGAGSIATGCASSTRPSATA